MAPADASTATADEPKYKSVLAKAQRKQGVRSVATYRVVVCGPLESGKRTAAAQLREALAFGDRVRLSVKKQCGVDYAYVDVRHPDGTMRHTVEFAIIDTPSLLDVALQAEHVSKAVVVFACNVSSPRVAIAAVNDWARSVNEHVTALVGADRAAAMALARTAACDKAHAAVADLLPPALTRADDSEGATDFDLRTVETVCLLPCAVAVTKLDELDALPATQVRLSASATVGSDRFLRDVVRATGVKLGAAVVMCPASRGAGGGLGGASATDDFQLAVASHLVAMAAAPDEPADTDALAGAFGCELAMSLFLPAGADTGRTIPRAIAAESIAVAEVFPAPAAEGSLAAALASPTSASPLEHHQAELKQLALTVAASPTPAVRKQSVAPDRGSSQAPATQSPAAEGSTAASAGAGGGAAAKEDSGDDIDLDFEDLE